MKPLVRWVIGPVSENGYKCLVDSIFFLQKLYDIEVVICQNGHDVTTSDKIKIVNQEYISSKKKINPKGVVWKLVPPRLDINRHEIVIDNDLVIIDKIPEIDLFLESNEHTLLLESESTHYGRFVNHVPKNYVINSGIYGMPPGFNFEKYINFYGVKWEKNTVGKEREELSYTFDEQGLVATALLSQKHFLIPKTTITTCDLNYLPAKGMHFVGLNRKKFHHPWAKFKLDLIPHFI